ncbi:MAG: AAA family ATPase [candidate division Zixibacteria bacterium]|nr:AAA family ATPase [candidate division Zixibacteria bacterium]
MKLMELEIWNVRGIPYLKLTPNGKNLLIWGPNGCGKSAVVDAIDFLLTGRISRLTGKGTAGLSLSKHGPHVDHEPEDAKVRAVIMLPDGATNTELVRSMAAPNRLDYDHKLESSLSPILATASQGQHVLTRREILKYVTAESSSRAQEIQDLLNITEIEDIRKALVKVAHETEKGLQTAKRLEDAAKAAAGATTLLKTYESTAVLNFANDNRVLLKGATLSDLHSTTLKVGITAPPAPSTSISYNVAILEKDIQGLKDQMSGERQEEAVGLVQNLTAKVAGICSDPEALRALSCLNLVELGIGLIDDSDSCPLCETMWPPGELRALLQRRLIAAQSTKEQKEQIMELASKLTTLLNTAILGVESIVRVGKLLALDVDVSALEVRLSTLKGLSQIIAEPIEKSNELANAPTILRENFLAGTLVDRLEHIRAVAEASCPKPTPEQTAWDTLTHLEENLKALEKAQADLTKAVLAQKRAELLLADFLLARDTVLQRLYDSIRDRFVELYRQLHKIDESVFAATIVPDGAGLDFQVDFYGRGLHPPHALHSEGHQDSMGLCLYMALAERLTKGLIDLTIFDDVVMSVDADHRRQLCEMLAGAFPERQFLITTHDRTWASQLQYLGVVSKAAVYEFTNWNIASGPAVDFDEAIWDRIDEDLKENAVSSAAHKLRWGSEQFFQLVCDALRVPVVYTLDGKHELGEYLIPAMNYYKSLVAKAQKAAKSWGNSELEQALVEIDSVRSAIFSRTHAEQWGINANVHYNNWANFTPNDFRPIVEAFADLHGLFKCNKCQSLLTLAMTDMKPVTVKCRCGNVDWNLLTKND